MLGEEEAVGTREEARSDVGGGELTSGQIHRFFWRVDPMAFADGFRVDLE